MTKSFNQKSSKRRREKWKVDIEVASLNQLSLEKKDME